MCWYTDISVITDGVELETTKGMHRLEKICHNSQGRNHCYSGMFQKMIVHYIGIQPHKYITLTFPDIQTIQEVVSDAISLADTLNVLKKYSYDI